MNKIFNIKTVGELDYFRTKLSQLISYDDSGNTSSYIAKLLGFSSYEEAYRIIQKRQTAEDIARPIEEFTDKMFRIDSNFCGKKINELFVEFFDLKIPLDSIVESGIWWSSNDEVDTIFIETKTEKEHKISILGTSEGMKAANYIPEKVEIELYSFIVFNLDGSNQVDISKEKMKTFTTEDDFESLKFHFSSSFR